MHWENHWETHKALWNGRFSETNTNWKELKSSKLYWADKEEIEDSFKELSFVEISSSEGVMARFLWKFKEWIIPRQKVPEYRNTENDAILIPKLPDVQAGFWGGRSWRK